MKNLNQFILAALVIPTLTFAQTNVSDNFSDGDFTNNPTWTGNTANFQITSGELQLNDASGAGSSSSYLSTPSTIVDSATWEFTLKIDNTTSSSNQSDFYLISDNADLSGSLNGYFVRMGGTSDEVSLYKQTGTSTDELIDGLDKEIGQSGISTVGIKVTRDKAGNWELLTDITGGTTYVSTGTANDLKHNTSVAMGVNFKYSSSRTTNYFLDNLSANGRIYIAPPAPEKKAGEIVCSPKIFAPAPLSTNPLLQETKMGYIVDTVGLNQIIANLFIFNSRGQMVKHLEKNTDVFATPEGDFVWDGTNDNNTLLPIGIYTIVLEMVDDQGGAERLKTACAIGTQH